jgi:hypothetical protein
MPWITRLLRALAARKNSDHNANLGRNNSPLGRPVARFGQRKFCWEAKGSHRDQFDQDISPRIIKLLEECLDSIPGNDQVTLSLYMVGRSALEAIPTIMLISRNEQLRRGVQKALSESGILSQYPEFGTKYVNKDPGSLNIVQLALDTSSDRRTSATENVKTILYDASIPIASMGVPIYIANASSLRPATANLVRVDDHIFFQTVHHAFCTVSGGFEMAPVEDLVIDSDSETEDDHDAEAQVEVTSAGSRSPSTISCFESQYTGRSRRSSFTPRTSTVASPAKDSVSLQGRVTDRMMLDNTSEQINMATRRMYDAIANVADFARTERTFVPREPALPSPETLSLLGILVEESIECDFALIEITNKKLKDTLRSLLKNGKMTSLAYDNIASTPEDDTQVYTYTASGGKICGVLSASTSYARLSTGTSFQKVYVVRLDGPLANGDCGSAVIDANTGGTYGHLVAGCRTTGTAYVLAAGQAVEDVAEILPEELTEELHSTFSNIFSKKWPHEFSGSRKPVEYRPFLESLIETVRSLGEEPEGDDYQLFMEQYDDDLTSLDVREAIRYLQINNRNDFRESIQSENRGTAWLDDRTLHPPAAQELSGSMPTVAAENSSPQGYQISNPVDDSNITCVHPPWNSSNEYNSAVVAVNTTQDSPHTQYHTADSHLGLNGARSIRKYPAPLTADDLYGYLRKRQFDDSTYLDADRRLIYIADPDASYLSALIRTARDYQVRSLRDIICKYISQDASIKISISAGCTEYQLEFHIPYLAMRHQPSQRSMGRKERTHRGWMNIDFLNTKSTDAGVDGVCGVYQAQISVAICGTDNLRWTAYCLEDRYFDDNGEIGSDEQTDDHQSDQIARGAFGAEDIIRDPREYFIYVLLTRMRQVYTERKNLVRRIESGIKENTWGRFFFPSTQDGIPPTIHDAAASGWIDPTVQLLGILLNDIANMNDAWVRFTSETGDAAYFLDKPSNPRIVTTMSQLNDVFNEMLDLEKKLRRIAEQCEKTAQTANLRLASDSERSAQLTVYFISPFAIISTLFAIQVPITGFPRNILSFSIGVVLYIVVFQAFLFFWGGGLLKRPWWEKISKRAKALRDRDPGFTKKKDGSTVLQRKATAESAV